MSSELRAPPAIRRGNTADDGCGRTGQDVRLVLFPLPSRTTIRLEPLL
ncbi:unnamed protein product [Angiostrongylus costaricensis]|uniref:DUF2735 domain-containing protein n=1 Tax=Angiostrongylus costaricensis TaxID=334426 RepID=A0A0R3PFA4_ANGCS|nr:unnamed protein product [Angiostrongylus costaricensis]